MMVEKANLPCLTQASTSSVDSTAMLPCSRERFYVELKPGETTFVSWKKLQKESQKTVSASGPNSSDAPAGAHPALEARIAPEVVKESDPLPPPPNRFNAMIEKIERLYQGGNSDDELSDCLDDDKYDTRDSFIDDSELNDYFSVENAKLKHDGFYVNRGTLEQEPQLPPPVVSVPKKRKKISFNNVEAEETKKPNAGSRAKAAVIAKKAYSPSGAISLPTNPGAVHKEERASHEPSYYKEAEKRNNKTHGETSKEKTEGKEISGLKRDRSMLDGVSGEDNIHEKVATLFDVNEPPEVDCLVMLERKESSGISAMKPKPVQKPAFEENLKESSILLKKSPSSVGKDISPSRAKGTVLERAFLDLEKGVAESCPPSVVARDPEQGKRNRLPPDIKQKLAKIARLAAKQGRITDELIERLMGILGHVMRVKTLKRNLKAMIEMGLCAMQEKEGRLVGIRKEVTEMIKSRVHNLQSQEHRQGADKVLGTTPEKMAGEGRYQWDHATEDKICDLYEQYIEGMDENKGPHLRKLYAELAELWPDGWMDNLGIKLAVHRAQERKKRLNKASNISEVKKRRRPPLKPKMETWDTNGRAVLSSGMPVHEKSSLEQTSKASLECEPTLNSEHEQRSFMKEQYYSNHPNSLEKKNKTVNEKLQVKKGKGEADTDIKIRVPMAHKSEKSIVDLSGKGVSAKVSTAHKTEKSGVDPAEKGITTRVPTAQKSEKSYVDITEKGISARAEEGMAPKAAKGMGFEAEKGFSAGADKGVPMVDKIIPSVPDVVKFAVPISKDKDFPMHDEPMGPITAPVPIWNTDIPPHAGPRAL